MHSGKATSWVRLTKTFDMFPLLLNFMIYFHKKPWQNYNGKENIVRSIFVNTDKAIFHHVMHKDINHVEQNVMELAFPLVVAVRCLGHVNHNPFVDLNYYSCSNIYKPTTLFDHSWFFILPRFVIFRKNYASMYDFSSYFCCYSLVMLDICRLGLNKMIKQYDYTEYM